jgi:hypothetical protein
MASQLQLSTYKPNFNDPRVRRKVEAVLKWCDGLRLFKNGRVVHHDKLTEVFGNRSQGGLSEWLYVNLLAQSGHYQPGKRSFSYRLKERGYQKVHGLLGSTPPTEVEVIKDQYSAVVSGDEQPVYKDRGDRRYHPIQSIKRDIRRKVFAGWWDYDIEACAPTLMHQFVITSKWYKPRSANDFPALTRLISEKQTVRREIGELTGLELQAVKELLSAVFFRGNPAPSHKAGMFRILGGDFERHAKFLGNPFVKQLRDDAKRLWSKAILYDRIEQGKAAVFEGRKAVKRPSKNSRLRMSIYLSLERRVIQVLEDEIARQKVSLILMHDGFMVRQRLKVDELEKVVKDKTGFSVRLSEVRLAEDQDLDEEADLECLMRGDDGEADKVEQEKNSEA